jgi:hypothetical protein
MIAGYVVGYSDESHTFIGCSETPNVLYKTLKEAEVALKRWAEGFDTFNPALYGEVYPYEHTTAEKELERTGRAIYGWGQYEWEERSNPVCIFSLNWA